MDRGFAITSVHRMKRLNGTPIPLVIIIFPKAEDNTEIHIIRHLVELAVKVESEEAKTDIGQCYRCTVEVQG
ncbi:unnamed protein product [Phaedon cochleariae]|uniref:Pre-C2HC domain-containing protein n=1 Tax=Phaedon cochleariae TaxID=80249 RepID=A0A9N9SIN0_PHACE|nr:unnamed protein product [Phaedon cochleariae]